MKGMHAHVRLAFAFALVGFVFTSKTWFGILSRLGPEMGLALKYASIVATIFLISRVDPSLKFGSSNQKVGAVLVALAFLLVFNYQSEWIEDSGSEHISVQTPDGAIYRRVREITGLSPEMTRLVTFVAVPFLLVLGGSKLIRNGQKLNLD